MPLTLHPLARTTPRIRAELRAEPSQVSDAELGRRYGIAPQTARKWRRRKSVADRSHRPRHLHCTMTPAQEVVAMAVREVLWLTVDDLLVVVREFLNPRVSRSGLLRCRVRYGLNRRPVEAKAEERPHKTFKDDAPGFVHVDIKVLPQRPDESSRRDLFVGIDRATRWVYLRLYADQSEVSSTDFLRRLQAAAPMKIVKLLTDNGSPFTDRFTRRGKKPSGNPAFDRECAKLEIQHRLSPPRHPQTNGRVERFNGRIRDLLAIKESTRWIEGYARLAELAETLPDTRLVYVADREADILELLHVGARHHGPPPAVAAEVSPDFPVTVVAACWHERSAAIDGRRGKLGHGNQTPALTTEALAGAGTRLPSR